MLFEIAYRRSKKITSWKQFIRMVNIKTHFHEFSEIGALKRNYYFFTIFFLRILRVFLTEIRGRISDNSNNRVPPPIRSKWRDRSWHSCESLSPSPSPKNPFPSSRKNDYLFILPVSTLNFTARPSRWTTFLFFQSSSWILGWLPM